jgi:CDP-paratose 2-epimerase
MYEHILVTGGAGFVGSSLARALKAAWPECRVTALDNLKRRGSELNLFRLREAGVLFLHADVRNPEDLSLRPPPGLVLECSAEPSVLAGMDGSPAYVVHSNLMGAYNCFEKARLWNADVIFFSTSRVYPTALLNQLRFQEMETRFSLCPDQPFPGASDRGISEEFPLAGARSLYGMTKYAAELLLEEYAAAYGLRYIVNRCGVIAGPWQMGKIDQGVIALWMAAHYFQKPLSYIGFGGQGKQVRDFIHIGDLTDLVLAQIRGLGRYQGRCFNVGGGPECSVSLLEATAICQEITGNRIPIGRVAQDRPADVRIYITDARRVAEEAQWRVRRGVDETFADIFDWLRAEEQQLRPVFV